MRGSVFLTTDLGEPTFQGEGAHEEEPASKPSKRRRDATTTDFGSNKKRKKSVDSRPCAACGNPYHSLKQCWLVIGAPEGRQVSEERKKAFAKKKRLDSDFAKLVKGVLKLKEEVVDD
jgi:hypothetical protein